MRGYNRVVGVSTRLFPLEIRADFFHMQMKAKTATREDEKNEEKEEEEREEEEVKEEEEEEKGKRRGGKRGDEKSRLKKENADSKGKK